MDEQFVEQRQEADAQIRKRGGVTALSGLLLLVSTSMVLPSGAEDSWLPALLILVGAFLMGDGVGKILSPREDADHGDH